MNSISNIEKYYQFLLDNPGKANKKILTVYSKLVDDIKNPKTINKLNAMTGDEEEVTYVFDISKAQRPIEFIEKFCKHSKGRWAGKPIKLELFQKAFIEAAFGFVDSEYGLRKYKKVAFFVAKKNTKSTLASAIGLYLLTSDGEGGAEVYSVAKVKDQAKIVWQEAVHMVKKSPALRKRLRTTINGIFYDIKDAVFSALASESNSLDGKNPFCVIADEIWAWVEMDLLNMMEDGMSAREQPMIIETSTMGTVREKVFDNEYEYFDKIIKGYLNETGGIVDETVLPIIYELDDPKEWDNEESWYKANPGLGVSKSFSYLREKVQKAKNNPASLPNLLCKDFNVRQTGSSAWLKFEELNNEKIYDDVYDCYCIGGCDLSSTTDLTCATLIFYHQKEIKVKQMYFLPENALDERVKEDQIPYDIWKKLGILRTSIGSKVDYHDVTLWFIEQVEKYGLRPLWIGYDSWNAQYWCDEMREYGFDMVEVRQGAKTFSSPMKQLKADLIDKKINYNNNPILKWCLSNVQIKSDDNENIRPIKAKSRSRIDGAVSLIDAYVVLINNYQDYMTMAGGDV